MRPSVCLHKQDNLAVVVDFDDVSGGHWRQRADERFGDPPPRWIQKPSVVRDRDERPPRGPPGSAQLLCV